MSPEELSQDDIDALLSGSVDTAGEGEGSGGDLGALLGSAEAMDLPDFGGAEVALAGEREPSSIDILYDVELDVKIELGRTWMSVENILNLKEGSVVQLDKDAGAPVDILVNGCLIGEGEVLVLNDYFCVRVTNIFSHRERAIISHER